MHISDGVLPTAVALTGYVASLALTAWSARRISTEQLPKVAVVSAAFFVAALIHIPLGLTSVHLLLPGLAGILLGSAAFPAIAVALLLQCILFQFGGLTALGANALMMGIPALLCGWFFHACKGRSRSRLTICGGLTGALGVILAAGILAALLAFGGEEFFGAAKLVLLAHLPVVCLEALISGFTVAFLHQVKPELLSSPFGAQSGPIHG